MGGSAASLVAAGVFGQVFALVRTLCVAARSGRALLASFVPGLPLAVVAWVWMPQMPFPAAVSLLALPLIVGLGGYLVTARLIRLEEPGLLVVAIASRLSLAARRTP